MTLVRRLGLYFSCLFFSHTSFGLGLGELSIDSSLNQQLQAEIELLGLDSLEEDQILIKMASIEDFRRAEVDFSTELNDIKFKILPGDVKGSGVLRLTTFKQIKEPYLNFVLDIRWPSGRILREYAILLDLPVLNQAPIEPYQPSESIRQPAASAQQATAKPAQARVQQASTYSRATAQVTTKTNDTLWSIASKNRPTEDVSVHQTMLAIQKLNPDAFVDNNINRLKRDQQLKMPSLSDTQQISDIQAFNKVREQNSELKQRLSQSRLPLVGTQDSRPQLADSSEYAPSVSLASGGDDSTAEALNAAQETIAAQSSENSELEERLAELEAQIESQQALLELKNNQLARLQEQAEAGTAIETIPDAESGEVDFADSTNTTVNGAEAETVDVNTAAVEVPLVESGIAKPATSAKNPIKPKAKKPVPAKEPSFFDSLMDMWLWVVLLVLLIVAGLGFFLLRKKQSAGHHLELTPAAGSSADNVVDKAVGLYEAGQEEQAIELLENAVEQSPHKADIRLALMQLYVGEDDATSVQNHLSALRAIGTDEDVGAGQALLEQLDTEDEAYNNAEAEPEDESSIEEFDGVQVTETADDMSDLNEDDSNDTGLDLIDELGLDDSSSLEGDFSASEELDFEFDESDSKDEQADRQKPLDASSEEFELDEGLDFDLDDDLDLDSPPAVETSKPETEFEGDLHLDFGDGLDFDDEVEEGIEGLDEDGVVGDALPDLDDDFDDDGLDSLFANDDDLNLSSNDDDLNLDDDDEDAINTKLELGEAYIDMGDAGAAKDLLQEVLSEGNDSQIGKAQSLLDKL